MTNNETQADIAREMRTYFQTQKRNGYPEHRPWHQVLSDWADRIEAAHRREKEQTEAIHLNEIIAVRKEAEDEFKHGNAAAMREVLQDVLFMAEKHAANSPATSAVIFDRDTGKVAREIDYLQAIEKARAALSSPPRNCDVGTPEEQIDRWRLFCKSHDDCDSCPVESGAPCMVRCAIEWLQMPYAEGGAK